MKSSRDDSLKLALKQIAQECRTYIITHIRAIFQGKGYLELPKEMFVGIISCNEVRGEGRERGGEGGGEGGGREGRGGEEEMEGRGEGGREGGEGRKRWRGEGREEMRYYIL